MKKVLISLGFAALALGATAQVKIKDGTVTGSSTIPSSNAILELESNQRGLLYPRVALTSTSSASPLSAHVKGMVVYDTVSNGSGATAVSPGIYYNDGTQWVRVGQGSPNGSDWQVFGGTSLASNTDSQYVTGRVAIGQNSAATVASAASGSAVPQQTAYLTVTGGDANINGVTVGAGGGQGPNTAIGYQAMYNSSNTVNNSTAIGYQAQFSNLTGNSNTAVGWLALYSNQAGLTNTAVGGRALQQITGATTGGIASAGSQNTAVGFDALRFNQTGMNNVGIGYEAMWNNLAGSNNVALGMQAGLSQTAGDSNIVIGAQQQLANITGSNQLNIGGAIFGTNMTGNSGAASSPAPAGNIMIDTIAPATVASTASGSTAAQQLAKFTVAGGDANINGVTVGMGGAQQVQNTAVGYQAMYNSTNSVGLSTAVGYQALASNTTGSSNTAVGYQALTTNQAGQTNTAVGGRALQQTAGAISGNIPFAGSQNTAVGFDALRNNTTGISNVAIGYDAMNNITVDSNNTVLGTGAGLNQTAGSNNIIIGYRQQLANTTGSRQLNIGGVIFGTGMPANGATGGGSIGINTTAPTATLSVNGTANNPSSSWGTFSDRSVSS